MATMPKAVIKDGDRIGFDAWWYSIGSGIGPSPRDDMESHAKRVAHAAWTAVASRGLLARCECGQTPRGYRVRVPHLTWTVICKCGKRTGYYAGGRTYAVNAWNKEVSGGRSTSAGLAGSAGGGA